MGGRGKGGVNWEGVGRCVEVNVRGNPRRRGERERREREREGEREEALTCQLAEVRETTHPWEIYTNTSLLLPVCGGEGG